MSLKDKVIIITGGNGLLGRSMCDDMHAKGAKVISFDLYSDESWERGLINCDVTDIDGFQERIQLVKEHFGTIDGFVNNAYPRTKDWGVDFEKTSFESWSKNVDWQMNSYCFACQKAASIMKTQENGGSIINISSIYGVVGNDFSLYEGTEIVPAAGYSAIKGGIINFSRYLASMYGKYGIRVNCVSPGGIFNHQDPTFVERYESKVPLKRMGRPDDIAPAVSFMLSDEAKYITGQNLIVDGGWTAI
ncbi:SDR family oxidoreductase [Carboxylicivirga sediminis]|uniref:SDR family oxidoreductase n=1 Tax=Carboxylicivirga sediminis TaxID=2006564 RepID=A0A941F7T9_9BACT|nr:SDR family oxidoreductase [Carboxylicivirga sediminis]MBR8537383.1 SDR family oxidoreductase [Carboxylicivirga sediminis]